MKRILETAAGFILLIGAGSENLFTAFTFLGLAILFMGLSKIKKRDSNPARLDYLNIKNHAN